MAAADSKIPSPEGKTPSDVVQNKLKLKAEFKKNSFDRE